MSVETWRRDGEAGSVLLWVMVVGLFAVGSLGAVMRLIPAGTHYSMQDSDTTYAFIAAESGIHYVMDQVRIHGPSLLTSGWSALEQLGQEFGATFSVVTDGEYVYVTGEYGGAKRTLRAKALSQRQRPKPKLELDVAVYALAGPGAKYPVLSYTGGANILGRSGTNADVPGSIRLDGGPTIGGDIIVGPVSAEYASSVVSKPDWMHLDAAIIPGEPRDYPLPEFLEEPFRDLPARGSVETAWDNTRVVIDQPGSYELISAGSGDYSVVFDTKGQDLFVRVKTLKVHGSGKVEVTGNGRLFLYVDHTLDLSGGGSLVHNGDPKTAIIYYAGSRKLTLGGGFSFRGVIYAKDAEVDIGGGFTSKALILSGGNYVTFGGGATLGDGGVIYAPKAHVDVKGGALTGIVIGNSVYVSGGATVSHRPIDFDSLPIEFPPIELDEEEVDTMQWHLCWTDCVASETT